MLPRQGSFFDRFKRQCVYLLTIFVHNDLLLCALNSINGNVKSL